MQVAGIPDAQRLLDLCLETSDATTRVHAAYMLASTDKPRAVARLASELGDGTAPGADAAKQALLLLGDPRPIPLLIKDLGDDFEATRSLACSALRSYTQQDLPCPRSGSPEQRTRILAQWEQWRARVGGTFTPNVTAARLDAFASHAHNALSYAAVLMPMD
jgi:hypothetical protein